MVVTENASTPVTLDSGARGFVEGLAAGHAPPIYTLSPAQAREVLESAQAGTVVPVPAVETLSVGPLSGAPLTIYRPEGAERGALLPAVLYFHGGGWILGSRRTHDRLMRQLAAASGAALVFVEYSRSPESRFPVAVEEAYAALQWVAKEGASVKLDPERLAVAGDSAGGNMAAVIGLMSPARVGPAVAAQLLFYPVTDAAMDTPSYERFADGPWLTRKAMEWFWQAYQPHADQRDRYEASPLRAPAEMLELAPPAMILTAEADVLRDEGEAYAARLMAAGVPVQALRYLGTIHDFAMLNSLAHTPSAQHAVATAAAFLRARLGC